jgi:ketosteroid isomerase-like protein
VSVENLELVREAFWRFQKGEILWDMLDEEVVIDDHDMPETRDYRGHTGLAKWLEDWSDPWSEWSLEPEEFLDAGDKVIVFLRMRAKGRGSGVEVDRHDALVYEFREGKTVRIDYYNSREQGIEAAGLPSVESHGH